MAYLKGIEMKSKYADNFRHKIVLIPPVLGKKTKQQAKPIVLGFADSKSAAITYHRAAEQLYFSRPGRVVIIPPSESPTVGWRGARLQREAA